jgi:hypothetical protein
MLSSPRVNHSTFKPVTAEIHQTICLLFQEMDTSSVWQLMNQSLRLKKIGEQLRKEVHPFQMLMEIFADKKTHEHFQSMYHKKTEILTGKHIVWNNFIQGLGENLESRKNEIDPYLNTFAKTMKISPLLVKSYLNHQDYNGLVSSIINAHSLQ